MALEIATAVQTPFPLPDMSSPSRSFENLSLMSSISGKISRELRKKQTILIFFIVTKENLT